MSLMNDNTKLPVVLRNPGFFCMWVGQMLGQGGLRMFQIAALWLLVGSAGGASGKKVGLFMVMAAIPSLALVKIIGKTVDRAAARKILLTGDAFAGAVMFAAALGLWSSALGFAGIVAIGFFVAAAEAFLDPTFNKAVKEVVDESEVEEAVAFQASTQSLANFGGAVAGAVLIDLIGIPKIILLCAFCYLTAGVFNYFIKFRPQPADAPQPSASGGEGVSGWKILDGQPLLKRVLIGFGLVNFFITPTLIVIPLYTSKTLHATASVLGQLEASLWIGLIAGTFVSSKLQFTRNIIKLGAFCIFASGAALAVPGLVTGRYVYTLALFLIGLSIGVNNVKFITLFQETVEPAIKGRFFALMQAMIGFTFPVAYFIFGLLSDFASPPAICLLQGAGVLALSAYFYRLSGEKFGAVK